MGMPMQCRVGSILLNTYFSSKISIAPPQFNNQQSRPLPLPKFVHFGTAGWGDFP